MFQAPRLGCRPSVLRRVFVLSHSVLAASGVRLVLACGDDASPSDPAAGSGGSAARSGGGAGAARGAGAAAAGATGSSGSVMITKGQALALRWTAGTTSGTRLHVLLDISQHGTSKGKIECDTDDDGSLDIAPKLVDVLLNLGFSGFPTVVLTRANESKPATGGSVNVLLNVSAPFRAAVEIPGLTSCAADDSQCPAGQICLPDLKCG